MLPLRHPRFWLLLGWLMVAIVIGASLMPARAVEILFGTLSDKAEHIGAYAGLMAWFGGMLRRTSQLWIGVGLVVLGGALELLQGLTPTRTPDVLDLTADSIGVLIGLVLSMTVLNRWCQRVENAFLVR
ncbi:MAG: VanZ family protein [Gammaproteobacteria bacterium]